MTNVIPATTVFDDTAALRDSNHGDATRPDYWDEPAGLKPRGTVIVIAGRGESALVYERFGRRIASDSWRVRVIDGVTQDVAAARGRIRALLAATSSPAPHVLVGSDVGAALALQLASEHPDSLDAVVIAGLPISGSHRATGAEFELRSACPVHRRTLDDESLITPGALEVAIPDELAQLDPGRVTIPVLAIHGEADPVVGLSEALEYYRGLPDAEIVAVNGGLHDILNDLSHRSVAATVVLFLERLKAGGPVIASAE
ncbi:MAG: aromatic ring-opening dioxygenase LigA [Glaciihabitans sp.]|jgi:pimeloyl-ACP methyl ester carboxylesterase|nr:aromatic ring-opening dioxygenase LigA [Glaciihabitans sp.]